MPSVLCSHPLGFPAMMDGNLHCELKYAFSPLRCPLSGYLITSTEMKLECVACVRPSLHFPIFQGVGVSILGRQREMSTIM